MKLKEWINTNNIKLNSQAFIDFAQRSGATPSYMTQVMYGRPVSAELAKRIEDATEGAVTRLECLYPEEYAAVA